MTRTSTPEQIGRPKPAQQGAGGHVCADCGGTVRPRPYKFVPRYADRCDECRSRHRRRALLRAHIVTAAKIAAEFGDDELALELHRLAERARR